MTDGPTPTLLAAAKSGDRSAFDQLFSAEIPKLRGVLYRMVGHPDEVDDLAQQALLRAYEGVGQFRADSKPSTWLCSIGTRLAIDHLRAKKRWREKAQVLFAGAVLEDPEIQADVGGALMHPQFSFDVNEHIAYCFTCIGRTLEPEAQAVLILRDVLELTNDEAAEALGLSHSSLRHKLASARETMQGSFENLCALVKKEGICWQCSGLRDASPDGHKGPDVPTSLDWEGRLRLVRTQLKRGGRSELLHDVFFKHTDVQEEERRGDEATVRADCGRPDAE